MNRRGFFTKLFDSFTDTYFLGVQVIFAANAKEGIWEQLNELLRENSGAKDSRSKKKLYAELARTLLAISYCFEYGYWDFIKKEEDAAAEFDEWAGELEDAVFSKEYEMTDSEDKVSRLSVRQDYIAVTMAFVLKNTGRHREIFDSVVEIAEDNYNERATYELLLRHILEVDFAECNADCVFIVPGNESDGLSWEDIHGEGWDYLAPIF